MSFCFGLWVAGRDHEARRRQKKRENRRPASEEMDHEHKAWRSTCKERLMEQEQSR